MRRELLHAALAFSLALPALATAEEVHARNVAFLWSLLDGEDPLGAASMPDGRVVTLAQAVDEAASRAGPVDLAAIASGSVSPFFEYAAGDVWVIEYGDGPCASTRLVEEPYWIYVGGQFWMYSGWIGSIGTTHGDITVVLGWSSKTAAVEHDTLGFTASGLTEMWCVGLDGGHFAFPFLDGEAHLNVI